jgi:hypothetical protein
LIVQNFTPEARKANPTLVDLLGRIAKPKKATPAEIALARLLRRSREDLRRYPTPSKSFRNKYVAADQGKVVVARQGAKSSSQFSVPSSQE